MTLWRLSGLIWMGLVAAGLVLIVLRVILKRSSVWLLNSNLIATYATLLICGLLDFSSVTATWNAARAVQHLSLMAAYQDRKSTRLNSSHYGLSRMPSSA